jgi:hypothetical protein
MTDFIVSIIDAIYVASIMAQAVACPALAVVVIRSKENVSAVVVPSVWRYLKVWGLIGLTLSAIIDLVTFYHLDPEVRTVILLARLAGASFLVGVTGARIIQVWDEISENSVYLRAIRWIFLRHKDDKFI